MQFFSIKDLIFVKLIKNDKKIKFYYKFINAYNHSYFIMCEGSALTLVKNYTFIQGRMNNIYVTV
jgi:general stress protein 26